MTDRVYDKDAFRKDELRGWDFSHNPKSDLPVYFAFNGHPTDEVSYKKMGGGPHSGGPETYPKYDCKYFDEKDPLCSKRVSEQSGGISGCCRYHRYKYNELLIGEIVNLEYVNELKSKGVKLFRDPPSENPRPIEFIGKTRCFVPCFNPHFQCKRCGEEIKDKEDIQGHLIRWHQIDDPEGLDKYFLCWDKDGTVIWS